MKVIKLIHSFRENLVDLLIHGSVPIVAFIGKYEKFNVSFDQLMKLPDGTLGKETAVTLKERNFAFIAHYETHDFKHILLNYNMDGLGEVSMQFFALGNGNRHFPTFAICSVGLFLFPTKWLLFKKDYKRGKAAKDITYLDYYHAINLPLVTLRMGLP